jgi:hypothetical protein
MMIKPEMAQTDFLKPTSSVNKRPHESFMNLDAAEKLLGSVNESSRNDELLVRP